MLVSDVKMMEQIEGFFIRRIPTLVRLQFLDDCHRFAGGSLYFSSHIGFTRLGLPEDRERVMHSDFFTREENQLTGEMIKGRAEIMDYVSDHAGPSQRNPWQLDKEHPLLGFRISLRDDSVFLGREEGADLDLQGVEVLFGPFDLPPNSV
jgi:hypothetical protein